MAGVQLRGLGLLAAREAVGQADLLAHPRRTLPLRFAAVEPNQRFGRFCDGEHRRRLWTGTQGEFITFLGYSIGSINETQSHLCAAYDRGYVARPDFAKEYQEATETRKTVLGLMNSMVQRGSGVKHMRRLKNFTDEVWERYERITGKPRPALFVRPKEDVGGQG